MIDPIDIANEEYQRSLERGEAVAAEAKARADDAWYDQQELLLLALDDYGLDSRDIQAIQSLRHLAMATKPISPAVYQQAILTALEGMNERVIEHVTDKIKDEEYYL